MLLAIMPFPVLRSMMSKIVSKAEQGERASLSLNLARPQPVQHVPRAPLPNLSTRKEPLQNMLKGQALVDIK